ncbi:MAG: hypothetical protein AB8B55_14300 [Mariniblastus sp.]
MPTEPITPEAVTSILDGLFGCATTANEVETPAPIAGPKVMATYNDCDGNLQFVIACELSIANSMGAALTMIPPGLAKEATANGSIPENIAENIHEVLNICSAAFANYHHHRIVLDQVIVPGDVADDALVAALDAAECLIQIDYELERYAPGKISLLKKA